jgi:hypothetical protein
MVLTLASKWSGSLGAAIGGLLAVSLIFAGVWQLNLLGARFLDKQLKDVEALGGV